MEQIETLLRDRLRKELLDVIEYDKLYGVLTDYDDKIAVEDMANDEFFHAKTVKDMLADYGLKETAEEHELWAKAKACFEG